MHRLPLAVLALSAVTSALAAGAAGPRQGKQPPPDLGAGAKADDVLRRQVLGGLDAPRTVFALRRFLQEKLKGTLRSHLVANGGHEHPARRDVMFMCFETYSSPGVEEDELFLGFFVGPDGETLAVRPGFVELIAWDRTKRAYNFYELIGERWHYRGDSRDILDDVKEINVASPAPKFGNRLRCSGCHTLGGPIMKELEPPHNDWWTTAHGLTTKPWKLEAGKDLDNPRHLAAHLFRTAADASNLSKQVKKGIDRLLAGGVLQAKGRSLKEQLRSLFGTMEMNFVSDRVSFKEREAKGEAVEIPRAFFVDERLAGPGQPVKVGLKLYKEALAAVGSRFPPESGAVPSEPRNAFLVPARSHMDNHVIDTLLARGLLDEELVAAVLAVDFTTPVYSRARAGLIRYVPDRAKDAAELRKHLIKALRAAPAGDRAARELLTNLTDPKRNAEAHRQAARAYLEVCAAAATKPAAVTDWLRVASQRRAEILDAETARNPQGNILERGFRLAFPADRLESQPGRLRLDPATGACAR
jgi:hypothetical protein